MTRRQVRFSMLLSASCSASSELRSLKISNRESCQHRLAAYSHTAGVQHVSLGQLAVVDLGEAKKSLCRCASLHRNRERRCEARIEFFALKPQFLV